MGWNPDQNQERSITLNSYEDLTMADIKTRPRQKPRSELNQDHPLNETQTKSIKNQLKLNHKKIRTKLSLSA